MSLDLRFPSTSKTASARGKRGVRASIALSIVATLVAFSTRANATSNTSVEQGYEGGEIQHPRTVGLGGAQSALGSSTSAIFLNPANLVQTRVYHFEALGAFGPEAQRQSYGGAVADSTTNRLAGGFGGTWSIMDPNGLHRSWTDLRLSLAYPLTDRIAFGVTGRYLRVDQGVASGPLGASYISDGTPNGPIFNSFTFDAGAAVLIGAGFHLGVVGKNLTAPGTGLAPTQVQGGLGYQNGPFTFEADALADFTTWSGTRGRYMFGGEYFVADRVPIRLGYRYDDGMKTHALSGGLGYVDRRWSIETGVRRDIVADHPATMITLGLRFFYEQGSGNDEPDPAL